MQVLREILDFIINIIHSIDDDINKQVEMIF